MFEFLPPPSKNNLTFLHLETKLILGGSFMKISTKGRYALRIMADIAIYGNNKNVSIQELSSRNKISDKYLEQIISLLAKNNLVTSFRGAQGGYKLSRPASEISAAEILNVTEGNLKTVTCITSGVKCELSEKCLTVNFWEKLNNIITEFFNNTTLEDIVKRRI